MGRNDWQRAIDQGDLTAVGVPRHRDRGWRVALGVLLLGTGAFTFAYYVPLFRAHATLNNQYRKLASEANTQRQQLTATIQTLKLVSAERDKIVAQSRSEQKAQNVSTQRTTRLEENLLAAIKKYRGKGRVELSRQNEVLTVTLGTPALLGLGTAEVTVFGKQALCALAGPLKTGGAQVVVSGFGVAVQPKGVFSFPLAAARAAGVAKQLSDGCGLEPNRLKIQVNQSVANPTLGAEIQVTSGS